MSIRLPLQRNIENALITINAVTRVVEAAFQAEFPVDPLLPDDVSQAISSISSVIKRHGPLIEDAMCDALRASGRYVVERRVRLPITELGRSASLTGGSPDVPLAEDAVDHVEADLLVVDRITRKARALQIKRGNGRTDAKKRRQLEADLRAAEPTLRAFAASLGHDVDAASVAIVDIYGSGGFSRDITILGRELDDVFEVPVILSIEITTAALRTTLAAMLPELRTSMGRIFATAETAAPFATRLCVISAPPRPKG